MQVQHTYVPGAGQKTPEVFVSTPTMYKSPEGTSDLVEFDLIS